MLCFLAEDARLADRDACARCVSTAVSADNWGLVAAGGEYLRDVLGLNTNSSWYKLEVDKQVHQDDSWTPNGEYQDHTGFDGVLNPMPYDLFARSYLSFMLAEHYDGEDFAFINDTMTRAAMTSLLLQSPKGEWPTGGRSSQHQWNEAVSILVFEIWASRFAAAAAAGQDTTYGVSNTQLACMLKRASNLALSSLNRWVNTTDGSDDVQVVKNWFPPQDRFGYEGYSFLTQYNLMPAAMVASALLYMDDSIVACPSLADAGGYVFELPNYHKVFANAGGTYVEFETGSDPHYDSTGLQRIHTAAARRNPLIGPTAGPAWEDGAVAVGPFWTMRPGCDAQVPQSDSLANATFQDVSSASLTEELSPNASVVSFSIDYALVDKSVTVRETVTVVSAELAGNLNLPPIPAGFTEAGVVRVDAQVQRLRPCADGGLPFATAGLEFLAMLFDGRANYTLAMDYSSNTALVQSATGSVVGATQYWVPAVSDSLPWTWTGVKPPLELRDTRNGNAKRVTAGLVPMSNAPEFVFFVRTLATA